MELQLKKFEAIDPAVALRVRSDIADAILQFQKQEQKLALYDEKMKSMEQQIQKCQEQNNSMWTELLKAKDREQNLERFFMIIFNVLIGGGMQQSSFLFRDGPG